MKGKILHVLMVLYYILLPVYILNLLMTYAATENIETEAITYRLIIAAIITCVVVVVSYVIPNNKRKSLKGELQENFERKTIDRQLTYCIVGQLAGLVIIIPCILALLKLDGMKISPFFDGAVSPIINALNASEIYSKQLVLIMISVGYMIFVTIPGITASLNLCSVGQFTTGKSIISMIIMLIPSVGLYYNIGLKIDLVKRSRRQINITGKIICSIIISAIVMAAIYFLIK